MRLCKHTWSRNDKHTQVSSRSSQSQPFHRKRRMWTTNHCQPIWTSHSNLSRLSNQTTSWICASSCSSPTHSTDFRESEWLFRNDHSLLFDTHWIERSWRSSKR
ncbi:hypothetical protein BLNAU_17850 [Blattamonas nauphoetae]|uniref:Uncharacterized protein n=1 Tax=Blattamonas nauphoetae TaxID=2049346 RepID=A0ABQ9XAB0_9EUKA|nr:hypothetical protein BLNAU_17850 [Blattamonas nauphoetae]